MSTRLLLCIFAPRICGRCFHAKTCFFRSLACVFCQPLNQCWIFSFFQTLHGSYSQICPLIWCNFFHDSILSFFWPRYPLSLLYSVSFGHWLLIPALLWCNYSIILVTNTPTWHLSLSFFFVINGDSVKLWLWLLMILWLWVLMILCL